MYYVLTFNVQYWMYKLRTLSNDTRGNLFLLNDNDQHSRLQAYFTSFLTIAASIPSAITMLLNTYIGKK